MMKSKRVTARIALAATAVAGGLLAVSTSASALTATASNAVWVEPGATRTFLAMCPSYAPTMLTDTISITAGTGVSITTSLDTTSDAFSRDKLTVTAVNGGTTRVYVAATASCTS
jgi:hypothetical protein